MEDESLTNLGINYSRSFLVISLRTAATDDLETVEIVVTLTRAEGESGAREVFDRVVSGGILGASTKVAVSRG